MTRAKLVLTMCKLQDYYLAMVGRKGTAETIILQNVLSCVIEYIADPSEQRKIYAEQEFTKFLKICGSEEE